MSKNVYEFKIINLRSENQRIWILFSNREDFKHQINRRVIHVWFKGLRQSEERYNPNLKLSNKLKTY